MPTNVIAAPSPLPEPLSRPVALPSRPHPPSGREIVLANRQAGRRVSLAAVRRWTLASLDALHADASLAIHLVGTREITRLNLQFLRHEGSTDIITFDHGSSPSRLSGELFISVPDAVRHAAEFHATWESELGRYIIHGLLHLAGEDDLEPVARRRMKRRENAILSKVGAVIPPASLALPPRHA